MEVPKQAEAPGGYSSMGMIEMVSGTKPVAQHGTVD